MSTTIQDDKGYNQVFTKTDTVSIRSERRYKIIMGQMEISESTTILEIGCGLGDFSHYMASHTKGMVTGIDICKPFIDSASEKYTCSNLQYKQLDFNKPEELQGLKFDYIVGDGILHHLFKRIDSAFLNLKSLLKEKGKILFLEPNIVNPYCFLIFGTTDYFRNLAKLEPDEKAFTKCFLRRKLSLAGYNNIKVRNTDFLIPLTPRFLVKPIIFAGDIAEKIPLLKLMSQSLFISAQHP